MNILQTEASPNFGGQEYEMVLEAKELAKIILEVNLTFH